MRLNQQVMNPKVVWWQDVRKRRGVYLAGLLAMLLTNGTEVLAPKALQWIIDALVDASNSSLAQRDVHQILESESFNRILSVSALFILFALMGLLGRVFWRFTLGRMTHVNACDLRQTIWSSIRHSDLQALRQYTLGDLMNRAIGDVNAARWIYGFTLVLTCDLVFFSSLAAIAMIMIHPGLGVACLSTFLVIPFIAMRLARLEYAAHDAAQNELAKLSDLVSQAVRGVRAQRASHSFSGWIEALKYSALRYADLRFKAQKISIHSFPLCNLPTIASYIILMFWGSDLVVRKELTVGEFAAMASYVLLLQGPLGGEIGNLIAEWQRGFSSLTRITELKALPEIQPRLVEDKIPVSLPKRYGDFEVREVLLRVSDLSIERDQRPILSRVSLQLHRGDWLALSGEVGSGKSTLLQTFAGLNRSFSGDVFVNGESIKALQRSKRLSDLRNIAYAAERPFVFSGSIKHNLCLNQSFTDQELWSVLSLVGLADELTSSCRDLESLVGEGGVSLSGGQRQRLALARLILRPSLLVLLDDPLSAVDTDTEAKVMKNLRRIWTDCAVICASNKPSTLSYCDKIGVVAHNRVEIDGASMSHVFHDHPKEISNFMEQPSHG